MEKTHIGNGFIIIENDDKIQISWGVGISEKSVYYEISRENMEKALRSDKDAYEVMIYAETGKWPVSDSEKLKIKKDFIRSSPGLLLRVPENQKMFDEKELVNLFTKISNKEKINELVQMGKIPNDSELSDEDFKMYDMLLASFEEKLSFEEAEQIINLFSDDCDDLNWGLVHLIETVPYTETERYSQLISKCENKEYREILEKRHSEFVSKKQ